MVGPKRTCRIVDAGVRKPLDLKIHVPVESMVEPEQSDVELDPFAGAEATRKSIWPAIYPEILELVRAAPSTIVFVNNRRGAERLALRLNELASHEDPDGPAGRDRPRAPRLARARGAARDRGPAQGRRAAVPGRHLEPRARHRHGRRRPRAAGRVAEVGHPRPAADRPRRPQRRRHLQGPHLPQVPRRPARVRGRRPAHARGPDRDDRRAAQPARRARPAGRRDGRLAPTTRTSRCSSTTCTRCCGARTRSPSCRAQQLENVLDMLDGRYPSEEFGELRPRIVWDRVAGTIRARKGSRALAITNAGTIPDRGLFSRQPARRPPRRRARRGDGLRGAPGPDVPARRDELADRGDHARPRDRHARARRAGRGAVLARRRRRAPARARRGDRRVRALGGRAGRRDARGRASTSTTWPPRTCSPSCASSRTPRAWCRATARSWSSASATRSATGGCASSRPTAAACTPPGASR